MDDLGWTCWDLSHYLYVWGQGCAVLKAAEASWIHNCWEIAAGVDSKGGGTAWIISSWEQRVDGEGWIE